MIFYPRVKSQISLSGVQEKFLVAFIANNMDPDQKAPFRSNLICVHIGHFHDKVFWRACSRRNKQMSFSEQKLFAGLGLE